MNRTTLELIDCHAHVLPDQAARGGAGLRRVLDRCLQQRVMGVVFSLAWKHGGFEVGPEVVEEVAAGHEVRVAHTFGFQPPSSVPQVAVLERETALLRALLPQTLDVAAITQALEPVRADIVNAKNEGQATGVAMKHLKSLALSVQGQDVAAAVKQIRTAL